MPARPLSFVLALLFVGCAAPVPPPPTTLTPTSDPVTRLVRNGPEPILSAGAAALREMGFTVRDAAPDEVRVYSEPMILQSTWRGEPVARRVVCGVGTAASSDPERLNDVSNTIPIEVRIGYRVEPRAESTATTILFSAEGRRPDPALLASPTMSCTLTVPFVNELFLAMESEMQAAAGIAGETANAQR